jgi:hypothetical protein
MLAHSELPSRVVVLARRRAGDELLDWEKLNLARQLVGMAFVGTLFIWYAGIITVGLIVNAVDAKSLSAEKE